MRRGVVLRALVAAALPAGLVSGCVSSGTPAQPTGYYATAAASSLPAVSPAARRQMEAGADAFGLSLFRLLDTQNSNMVFSPQILTELLAMILPGCAGQTRTQLADVLGAGELGPAAAADALAQANARALADGNKDSNTLAESSDAWTGTDVKLAHEYLAVLAGAFGTGVHQADFADDPDGSRTEINNLVSQETHGYINELFPQGSITAATRLVLTDAVYMNAKWALPFSPSHTAPAAFYPAQGPAQQTPMMSQTASFDYASGSGWQLLEMPYAGNGLAMDVVLPTSGPGTLAAARESLTPARLSAMLGAMRPQSVAVDLPKFTTDYSPADLMAALGRLGLGGLFTGPNLTGMTADHERLRVSAIVEQAHIQVAETGTVAAAAGGAGMAGAAAAPATRAAFDADHPFLYLIRDLTTGQILFAGQYASPSPASAG